MAAAMRGGQYGNIITNLLDIRNSYGRGDFKERWIDPGGSSAIYVFERENSAVVGLNIGYNPGVATRTVDTSFAPGTHLVELTGNWQDASGQVPQTVTVVQRRDKSTINIPWNNAQNQNKGYVIYGLPRPRGTLALECQQTIAGETPTRCDQRNRAARRDRRHHRQLVQRHAQYECRDAFGWISRSRRRRRSRVRPH